MIPWIARDLTVHEQGSVDTRPIPGILIQS